MKEQLIYLSPKAKIALVVVAAFLFLTSITLVTYLLFRHPNGVENIISASLALAQACATACGFIIVLFFSRFSMNLDDIKQRNDNFLAQDLPEAMHNVEYAIAPPAQKRSTAPGGLRKTKVEVSFTEGTNLALYRVHAYGMEQNMSVMFNVKRIVISYQFPMAPISDWPAFQQRFAMTVAGAEHAGYRMEWREVVADDIGPHRMELRALGNLSEEFLVNPLDKLFTCNDIAIMTRSIIKCRLPA